MIKQLYIHAGSHKTGTTSIQRFLEINAAKLRDRDSLTIHTQTGFFKRSPTLKSCGLKLEYFRNWRLTNSDTSIISQENFSWVNRIDDLVALKRILDKFAQNTKIIFYLRRQDTLAVSQKQQGSISLPAAIAYGHEPKALPTTLSTVAKRYLDFDTKINMWAEAFGQENVILRVFEKDQLHDGDAVNDFCQIIGFETTGLKFPKKWNETLSRESQLFLHQTRKQFIEKSIGKNLLVEAVRRIDRLNGSGQKLLPSESEAREFYAQFREGNRKLNRQYEISDHEHIFNEDFSMYPAESDQEGLSQDEINAKFFQVIEFLAEVAKQERGIDSVAEAQQLRVIALKLPEGSRHQTIELLELAHAFHPDGKSIKSHLKKFKNRRNLKGAKSLHDRK